MILDFRQKPMKYIRI